VGKGWTIAALAAAASSVALVGPARAAPGEPDCDGPPPAAAPGTPQWDQREADNVFCGSQRSSDTSQNPLYSAAAAQIQAEHGAPTAEDPFRDPAQLAGTRFRYEAISFANRAGDARQGFLFRPCDSSCHDRPPGLRVYEPPYPAVVIVHGGAANQEMYLWGAEALAEAGYMVLTFQIPEPENAAGDSHYSDAGAALDYLMSTPSARATGGAFNPRWTELDREHVGLAGHSAGGVAVSRLGQEDPRVSAIVSWDRAQSGPMPAGLRLRTPALFLTADFNCQKVPVCLPERYAQPPDPHGPGNKDEDFQRVSGAQIDSMKISLRAATHLDFTQFSPTPPSSRYGAIVASYYTLAWFDRYLKHDDGALPRLTATTFDGSADVHYISGGTFDPATQRNVPAHIAGRPVADRLSFHFRSAYYFGRGRLRCEDIRAGCPRAPGAAPPGSPGSPAAAAPTAARCKRPRFLPRAATVRRGRARVRPVVRCGGRRRRVVVRMRAGRRAVYAVAGRRVTLRVPARQRRVPVTYSVDGGRHGASIALRRPSRRTRFTG
jgi:dienelactone hydrolase